MAYFYKSNYSQNLDNYQYYDQYYYNNHDSNHELRYVNQYSNTEYYENACQHAPSPSLVGYYYSSNDQPECLASKNANFQENVEYCYYDPASIESVVSYNSITPEGADVVQQKDPKTVPLGDVNVGSVPPPGVKQDKELEEDYPSDFEDDEEFDDDEYDEDDEEYEDYDNDEYDDEELEEDKQEGVDKEPPKVGPIVPMVGVLPTSEAQSLGAEAKAKDGGVRGEVIQAKKALDLEVNNEGKGEGKGKGNMDEPKPKTESNGEVIQEKKALDLGVNDEGKSKGEGEGGLGEPKPQNESIREVIQPMKALDLKGKGEGTGKGDSNEPKPGNDSVGEVIQEEKALEQVEEDEDDFEESESEGEFEDKGKGVGEGESNGERKGEGRGELGDVGRKPEDYGNQVRRQIPPGYGMEAYDICEGLFGGYFPCLRKRNQNSYNHQKDVTNENISDYDYCFKETADYLFGNPNPYGGSMLEKGSYGDPMYNYQRYYPQQSITEQVEHYGENSSYLHN